MQSKQKNKICLASKKAVDWEVFLKSKFVDLRNFEELVSHYRNQFICSRNMMYP